MTLNSKTQYKQLNAFQLKIDLNSPRFASKVPSSQKEAIDILSDSNQLKHLMDSIENEGIFEPLKVILSDFNVIGSNHEIVPSYLIIEGARRYVSLLKLKKRYLENKKKFPTHFIRIPCLIIDEELSKKFQEGLPNKALFPSHWSSYEKALNIVSFLKKFSIDKVSKKFKVTPEKINQIKQIIDLMNDYKLDENKFSIISWLVKSTDLNNIFSAQSVDKKNFYEKFIASIQKGDEEGDFSSILWRNHFAALAKKNNLSVLKKFCVHGDLEKSKKELLLDSLNEKDDFIPYRKRLQMQFNSPWEQAVCLDREFKGKTSKERDEELDKIAEEFGEEAKNASLIKLKAYESFMHFTKTLEIDDKCLKIKSFEKTTIEKFKKNLLNESEINDFIYKLKDEFFDFFYNYENLSKEHEFCFLKKCKQPFSFYLRQGKFSELHDLNVIKELCFNMGALQKFKEKDAAFILERLEIFNDTTIDKDNSSKLRQEESARIDAMIDNHESAVVELKSTFSKDLKTNNPKDPVIRFSTLKAVNSLLNTKGGTVLIGVTDDKKIIGIEEDDYEDDDKYLRVIDNLLNDTMGSEHSNSWDLKIFRHISNKKICIIECLTNFDGIEIYYKKYNESKTAKEKKIKPEERFFFKRGVGRTERLDGMKLFHYVSGRKKSLQE